MIDYHLGHYKLTLPISDLQHYYLKMEAAQFQELLRQARLAGQEGAAQAEA